MLNKIRILPIIAALTGILTAPVFADLSEKHVQVAMKSLKFAQPKIGSGAVVAIIYAQGDSASKALADSLSTFIASGKAVKKIKLTPKVMPADAVDLTGARLVFVTDAAIANISNIASAANSNQALTIASDTNCSVSGLCAMTIETDPKVQIYLSSDAAQNAGVSFSNAFMMLVKKH